MEESCGLVVTQTEPFVGAEAPSLGSLPTPCFYRVLYLIEPFWTRMLRLARCVESVYYF